MRQESERIRALGAQILAISPDGAAEANGLIESQHLDFPILCDGDLSVTKAYGVFHDNEPKGRRIPRPAVFVIDRSGVIRWVYVSSEPSDRPDIATDVCSALEKLERVPVGTAKAGHRGG